MRVKTRIRTKEVCPVCGKHFEHFPKLGFICEKCKTKPKKFFIDISYKGQRVKVYSDRMGHILDSYNLTLETSYYINTEIRDGSFDPSKYVRKVQAEFYAKKKLQEYFEKMSKTIAPSNKFTFRKHIEMAKQFFGNTDVREIRKVNLIKYTEHLQELGLAQKTVKNYLTTLKAFMNHLKNNLELISEVPHFPTIDVPQPSIRWLSNEDQAKIYAQIPDDDKPIFAFMFLMGCRPGEARALKVKDLDLQNETLTIHSTFSKNVEKPHRKGKRSPSVTLPIHPELLPILKEAARGKAPNAYVFCNPRTGGPYSQNALGRIWNNIRNEFKLDKSLRLYDATRHSFASNLLNRNVPLAKISKLLGHTNTTTTERYAHMDVNSLKMDIRKVSIFQLPIEKKKQKKEDK